MPIAYNGNSSGVTVGLAVTVTNPVDADPLSASSNNAAVQTLANVLQFLQERALINNGYNNPSAVANAAGVMGTGNGTGPGVHGIGGATDGHGVRGEGTGTGSGVYAVGGPSAGGSAAVTAIAGAGVGSFGVAASSGAVSGVGVRGDSSLFRGVEGVATGDGADGVYGRVAGLAATGAGVVGDGNNKAGAAGVRARNGTGRDKVAIEVVTGHLKLASGSAANTEAFTNSLVANNIVKALGVITWNNGAPTLVGAASFNVSSVSSPANGVVEITCVVPVGYAVLVALPGAGPWCCRIPYGGGPSPHQFFIETSTGTRLDFSTSSGEARFIICGFQ